MGTHIGGGEESWIWHLSTCHPSRKWLARVQHVLVFCLLLAAKFDAPYINLSTNICLLSATDVMEHFAFPGNKDFAADYQGAFTYYSWKAYCIYSSSVKQCLPSVNHEQFPMQMTHKHNKWLQILAEGDFPPKSFHCPLEREHRLEIQREQKTVATNRGTERTSLNEFRMLK